MKTLCIAHRGASAEAPENTLPAFRRALALGVDGIELDTQVTSDGVAVVFHDRTLTRLTGSRGRLAEHTSLELLKLRVRGELIPTLAEVLVIARGRTVLQIEIKPGVRVAPVLQAIRQAGPAARVILASSDCAILRETAVLAPKLPRMLIASGSERSVSPQAAASRLLRAVTAAGASGVSVNHQNVKSARLVEAVRSRGAQFWCWTVNDPVAMRRMRDYAVDAIVSDDPATLIKTLAAS
jgi:glycerophosphoryl diester phosphodiesterase